MTSGDQPDPRLREQSMGELFRQLSEDLSSLVRQELRLAQAEMTAKGKRAGIGVGIFGGAGVLGVLALGTLSACIVAALAEAMDVWLAALIVTVAYAAIAGVLALQGRERIQQATPPVPEQTVERAMGEDPAAIRQEIEATRDRMGETVDALSYRADVPARTRDSVQEKVQGVKSKLTGVGSQVSRRHLAPATSSTVGAARSESRRRTRSGSPSGPPRSGSSRACSYHPRVWRTSGSVRSPTR